MIKRQIKLLRQMLPYMVVIWTGEIAWLLWRMGYEAPVIGALFVLILLLYWKMVKLH